MRKFVTYFNNQNSIQFYNSLHTSSSSGKHFSPNNLAASSNRVWAACPSFISPPSSRGPPLGLPTKAHATELDILWCTFPWVRRGPHRQCPTPSVDVICHSKPRPCFQARCGFYPKRRLDLTESLPVLWRCRSTCSGPLHHPQRLSVFDWLLASSHQTVAATTKPSLPPCVFHSRRPLTARRCRSIWSFCHQPVVCRLHFCSRGTEGRNAHCLTPWIATASHALHIRPAGAQRCPDMYETNEGSVQTTIGTALA